MDGRMDGQTNECHPLSSPNNELWGSLLSSLRDLVQLPDRKRIWSTLSLRLKWPLSAEDFISQQKLLPRTIQGMWSYFCLPALPLFSSGLIE